jgi:hypothetical protein
MSDQDILEKINALKSDYYATNSKNILFKKQQKFEIATNIMQTMDINAVLSSVFRIENTSLVFNYALFKTVACPEIYTAMVSHVFARSDELVQTYGTFQTTLDFKGLTMTGVERYKGFVSLLSQQGAILGHNLLAHIDKIYIVNPPSIIMNIAQILLPLVDPSVKDKLVLA